LCLQQSDIEIGHVPFLLCKTTEVLLTIVQMLTNEAVLCVTLLLRHN